MRVKNKVERLLKEDKDLRSSDKKLLLAYWRTEGLYLSEDQERKFMDCTVAESITRSRRMLRDEYPGNEQVEEKRYEKFQAARGWDFDDL